MSNRNRPVRRSLGKNGRTKHGPSFVRHFHYVLDCPAYRDLPALPRAVYMVLRRRFNGRNNGNIYCSVRDLAKELHCSKDSAAKALWILADHGFITSVQPGSFNWKSGKASTWTLTEEALGDNLATKDFLRWQPSEKKVGPKIRTKRPVKGTLDIGTVTRKPKGVPE